MPNRNFEIIPRSHRERISVQPTPAYLRAEKIFCPITLEEPMTNRSIRRRVIPLTGILLLLFGCVNVFGQGSTSSINGTVTDAQGNVVAGATVTLSNPDKSFSRTQTTTDSGRFAF